MNQASLVLITLILLSGCAQQQTVINKKAVTVAETLPVSLMPAQDAITYDFSPYSNDALVVSIFSGRANFNNIDKFSEFIPLEFIAHNNETQTIRIIKSGNNFFNSETTMIAFYKNGILTLDNGPNPYAFNKTGEALTYFQFEPGWLTGKTYTDVNTYGEASLDHVSITVKLIH